MCNDIKLPVKEMGLRQRDFTFHYILAGRFHLKPSEKLREAYNQDWLVTRYSPRSSPRFLLVIFEKYPGSREARRNHGCRR